MNKNGVPARTRRSGSRGERRGKGAQRSFQREPEMEWSGFRPDENGGYGNE